MQRLKREPQFVDAIFSAKTERTKMEEEPAMAVPDTEQNFIIEQEKAPEIPQSPKSFDIPDEEFDLSDISHRQKSREDIIAEAEAAAFAEE